jgi:putative transposase
VVAAQAGELGPQSPGDHAFEAVDQAGDGNGGRKLHQVDVLGPAVELTQLRARIRARVPRDLLHPLQVPLRGHRMPPLGHKIGKHRCEEIVFTCMDVAELRHETTYATGVQLRYNYRLDPRPGHRIAFSKAFGCARVVFNDALAAREKAHEGGLPYLTDGELSARLTAAKATPERAWLNEVSAVVLQQALADLNAAYRNFFASLNGTRNGPKVNKPRFRSRKDHRQAIRFTANARFKVLPNRKLRLPKIGDVPVRWSRPLPSRPSSVTIITDAAGRYFASFVIETQPAPLPQTEPVVGIDLGLTHFAVLSDGRKITAPRFLRRAENNLKRRQRDLSRKQKGSRNRDKARVKVARAHAKVADARRDFCHQLSTALIRDNQAIAVEDLAVNGLGRTRLAKSIHDAGWSAFVAMLEYKARLYGRTVVKIGRFVPTSQTCCRCGVKDGPKPLHARAWRCAGCGAWLDRDINAAVNVAKAAGLAVTACGAVVRPGPALADCGEAGTHPKSHRKPA